MPVVIEDFEVVEQPPAPAPATNSAPQDAQRAGDIDPFQLAEALARRQWSLQRVHAD